MRDAIKKDGKAFEEVPKITPARIRSVLGRFFSVDDGV